MLSRAAFEQGIATLRARFKLQDAATPGYYAYLAPRMTEDQFRAACAHLFAHASRLPPPAGFLDAAPEPKSAEWGGYLEWPCDLCNGQGHSLGVPRVHVCVPCLQEIGRARLHDLRQKGASWKQTLYLGSAVNVGLGVILEERGERRFVR